MPDTVRVRFTRPYTVQDADLTHYPKDSEHDLSEASAMHFVNRNAAVVIEREKPKPKPEPEAKDKAPAKPKAGTKS